MKRTVFGAVTAGIIIFFSTVFLNEDQVFSLPSKFEGKSIVKVEYFGVKKGDGDKVELIPLKNIDDKELREICRTKEGTRITSNNIKEDIRDLTTDEGDIKESVKGKPETDIIGGPQFLNVKVEVQEEGDGVRVRFYCEERAVIDAVNLKGVEELQESDILNKINVKEGDYLREDLVRSSLEIIKQKYVEEGFFNSVVTYKIRKVEDEPDKNAVEVDFIIDEGEEAKVQKITILGTNKISAWRLRKIMETDENSFISDGKFTRAKYEEDKMRIIAYYKEKGYLDADIVEDKVDYEWLDPETKEERGIYITIRINEGDIYYFDGYSIEGNTIISTPDLEKGLELPPEPEDALSRFLRRHNVVSDDDDVICNDTLFQKDRYSIGVKYGDKGYLFTRVTPVKTITEREKFVDGKNVKRKYVHYKLSIFEGKQAYIENIIVKGNKKTKDKVIRREILLKEGELYNATKLQMTREKLYRLGYFKEVNIDIRPGSTDEKVNMVFTVVEQSTGTVSLGGGWGTNTGFSVFASVGENNLMGLGYKVNVRFEYGEMRSAASIGFVNPWFMDYPVSFSTSIFYELNTVYTTSVFPSSDDVAVYKMQTFGYNVGFDYRFWYYYGIGIIWTHSFSSIFSYSGNVNNEVIKIESLGLQEKREITDYIYYDNKDSDMNPTKGMKAYFGITFVGGPVLWGDDHYIEYNPSYEYYVSPFKVPFTAKYPVVFQARISGNFIRPPFASSYMETKQRPEQNPWVEQQDRLFLGGPETLRGWDYFDKSLPVSWQNRLYHRILYGFEMRFPLHLQYLWMALFFDSGSLWSDSWWEKSGNDINDGLAADKANGKTKDINDIYKTNLMSYFKYSWGIGFRVQIPMLPLRFWFGKKAVWAGVSHGVFKPISGYNFQFQLGEMTF